MRARAMSKLVLGSLVLVVGYLAAWPTPIAPAAWEASSAPALEGPYAPNDRLAKVEWLGRGSVRGPEAVAVDAGGRVHTGTLDGRIVRFDPTTGAFETIASTGGRPLGLAFDRAGNLLICDAGRGLLSLAPSGEISVLATEQGGVPFRLPDDVDVGSDGTVYFTDASSRFGIEQIREDVLEHAGNGRLLAWRPATRKVELLLARGAAPTWPLQPWATSGGTIAHPLAVSGGGDGDAAGTDCSAASAPDGPGPDTGRSPDPASGCRRARGYAIVGESSAPARPKRAPGVERTGQSDLQGVRGVACRVGDRRRSIRSRRRTRGCCRDGRAASGRRRPIMTFELARACAALASAADAPVFRVTLA
jgi:hypothetical protein